MLSQYQLLESVAAAALAVADVVNLPPADIELMKTYDEALDSNVVSYSYSIQAVQSSKIEVDILVDIRVDILVDVLVARLVAWVDILVDILVVWVDISVLLDVLMIDSYCC